MKNIFVGNLSFNASEGWIREMFEEFGTVSRVSIATDRDTGEQRGSNQAIEPITDSASRRKSPPTFNVSKTSS